MKKLFFIAFSLVLLFNFNAKLNAQTECPNLEWMRFVNDSETFVSSISHIYDNKNELVFGSYDGSPMLGNIPLPPAYSLRNNSFIAKTDSSGQPLWIKIAKHESYGSGFGFINPVTDSAGNIYTAINFTGVFDLDGTTYTTMPPETATLLLRISPQGQILSTHLIDGLNIAAIQIDQHLNWCIASQFTNTLSIGNQNYTSHGERDLLVFKLNLQYLLLWAKQIGGNDYESIAGTYGDGKSLKADHLDNLYLTGSFESSSIAIGNIQLTKPAQSQSDIFVTKLDNSGNVNWAFSANIQDSSFCTSNSIALDKQNNVYVTGGLSGTFKPGNTPLSSFPAHEGNTFLMRYNPAAQQFHTILFKGGQNVGGGLLYLPNKDELLLSGWINSPNPVDFYMDSIAGSFFVTALKTDTTPNLWIPSWIIHGTSSSTTALARSIVADNDEHIYLSGEYSGPGILFGNDTFPTTPTNVINGFQAKLGGSLNRDVTVDSGVFTAVQDSALYQWLDCSNDMQPIPGATQQSFSAAQPGNYAVRVSNSLCSVVSDCINTTGISKLQLLKKINIYPNPLNNLLNLSNLPSGTQISVFGVLGRSVYTGTAVNTTLHINTSQWASGLYMVQLSRDGTRYFRKVVKE